ncbi:hypothetical protein KCP76_08170 [Salmonella enterica subsp. enterica serovar Weltevreden]|nr:hypothetical protein KCP76_08170 [Salmonella enterica subsp. enterica serovar Weltevreden]
MSAAADSDPAIPDGGIAANAGNPQSAAARQNARFARRGKQPTAAFAGQLANWKRRADGGSGAA